MVQMRIEKDFLTTSFSVLEEQPMDMLLGLDMLKRHQVISSNNLFYVGFYILLLCFMLNFHLTFP